MCAAFAAHYSATTNHLHLDKLLFSEVIEYVKNISYNIGALGNRCEGSKPRKGYSNIGWRVVNILNKHTITLNSFEPPTAFCAVFYLTK